MNQVVDNYRETLKCHSCNHTLEQSFYCFFCEKIQEIKGKLNYFSIFGLETTYQIDLNKVDEAFDLLILVLHPDYYAQSSETDKSLALEYSTLLNNSKATLIDPLRRAKYLLSLFSPLTDQASTTPPKGFITEMFSLQEELDHAEETGTISRSLKKEIEDLATQTEQFLGDAFIQLESKPEDKLIITTIQEEISKFKFIRNLQDRSQEIEQKQTNLH